MKNKLFIAFFVLVSSITFAQGEANNWFFGLNAGVSFNSGSPVQVTGSLINTDEGSASISDASGQLLFYTDGIWVYDKYHNLMINGTGLMGNSSTTQSATIVPMPGSNSLYYVFTIDAEAGINGFRYSVVDMTANGGLGEVTSIKNVLIYTPTCEKIAVIKHTNTNDFWIVTHGFENNNFYAYLLSNSGLNPVPIVSSLGFIPVISTNPIYAYASTQGYMKFSSDGAKLAVVHNTDNLNNGSLQLFDFNSSTGVISNPITLLEELWGMYGVEFSPNNNILYFSNLALGKIVQFDLLVTDIPNSAFIYPDIISVGALQIAPDGKIYFPQYGTNYLGVINNPNIFGIGSNLQGNAVSLGDGLCRLGLPVFIQSYFYVPAIQTTNLCLGDITQFSFNNSSITSANWNFGDGTTSTLLSPTHVYASSGDYTVSVQVNSPQGTSNSTKAITISGVPVIANTVSNQSVCGTANQNYDVSQFNAALLGSQSTSTYGVAYFSSMANATAHTNVLANIQNLPLGITTFYAKVYNLANTSCNAITNFTVTLSQQPVANTITDYLICENLPYNNIEQFNLSTQNASLLGTQAASDFTISYHTSQNNANANVLPLSLLYSNTIPQETIYARIQNNANPSCFATTSFLIKVIQQPQIITVSDYKICDDVSNDGTANFVLNTKTNEILNGQSAAAFLVKYFTSLSNAQNDTNAIDGSINYNSSTQLLYYAIQNIGNSNCKAIGSFNIVVSKMPIATTPSAIFLCDDNSNDGVAVFQLQNQNATILGSQLASNYTISYHLNQNDANANSNPLIANYQNTANPQMIYARIQNNQNTTCFATTSFQIGVNTMAIANQPTNLELCDDASNDGKEPFDLSTQTAIILGTQPANDFAISYHLSQADANVVTNDLALNYVNITNPQTIYARIENRLATTCFATTTFQLIVRAKPLLLMNDIYSICQGSSITITAPAGFSSYAWSNGATSQAITVSQDGNYSVTVTKNYGNIICNDVKNFTVYNSNIATITQIITTDWTDNQNSITILVDGDGDYEYSIDGYNYQDSNTFTGLPSGEYTVYVNDKKGCGIAKKTIFLLMYPKYFTPNGDGIHDTWQIKFSLTEPNMELIIFDRYGKLITNFKGTNFGWDGTLNGYKLPSDDYWFVVKRQNGKEYRGHFALKR